MSDCLCVTSVDIAHVYRNHIHIMKYKTVIVSQFLNLHKTCIHGLGFVKNLIAYLQVNRKKDEMNMQYVSDTKLAALYKVKNIKGKSIYDSGNYPLVKSIGDQLGNS